MNADVHIDTSFEWVFTITKKDGTPLAGSAISQLTLTIQDTGEGAAVVNGRSDFVLAPASSYVDINGIAIIPLTRADNVMAVSGAKKEVHFVMVKWTYNGGTDKNLAFGQYTLIDPEIS